MAAVPEFDSLEDAIGYMSDFDYAKLGAFGTYKSKRVLLVLQFSRAFTPQLLEIKSRYSRKAIGGAFVDIVKSQGGHAVSALSAAHKGNIFGAIGSLFKVITAKGMDESEWLDSVRASDEEVYQYAKLDEQMRMSSLFSRPHIVDTMGIAHKGPVYYGQDTQDGRQIFFYKLSS